MQALFSLVLALLLLPLSTLSSKKNTPPETPQMLLGTWSLAKYVHKASSPAGVFFRNDSTIIPRHSNTYWVTFNADGTVERPAGTGNKETYACDAPSIIFYYSGAALPHVTSSIKELTPNKLRISYRKEQAGTILHDDFFYVRSATVPNM